MHTLSAYPACLSREGTTASQLYDQLRPHEFDQRGGMARVAVEGTQQERAVNSELFGRRALGVVALARPHAPELEVSPFR